ncbi:N-acetylglucosamine transport system permease protein [Paenibacillus sp. cl6col]|uniref:Carbohydrate ABC transporter permease n=2 Tax=Paenibacillus TaxID=44249 RepID=A0ABT4EBE6_PAEAL|nr:MULTISPECIES: carbohydrate ABC transporter permease [Paenibacillus]EPY10204.1 binding-protein-dependent transport systems inner membrane component [Paenibacillus alvei A6-6i-x]MCY9531049.1 carbohydrate ABC transporter permease [Paenibacillus alvei]SDF03816.1 N-acetylglucosamine transport system permease protein [Paenibacillus sp. cl6col]
MESMQQYPRKRSYMMVRALMYALLGIWTLLVIYPLLWSILGSFKTNQQFLLNAPWSLPEWPFEWANFTTVWNNYHLGTYFMNSLIVTVVSTVLALLLSSTTSYIIARFPFRGSMALYNLYLSSMMIPLILGLIPLFFLLSNLHLDNSLLGLILVYTVTNLPFGVFVLVGFFRSMPKELDEAASIDGSSHYGVFFRIMLPLAKPGLISVGMMNVLNIWNEYIIGTVLVNDPEKYTIPVGIAIMQAEMQYRTEWGPLFAGLLLSIIPVLILYMIFQKQITSGMMAGAIK